MLSSLYLLASLSVAITIPPTLPTALKESLLQTAHEGNRITNLGIKNLQPTPMISPGVLKLLQKHKVPNARFTFPDFEEIQIAKAATKERMIHALQSSNKQSSLALHLSSDLYVNWNVATQLKYEFAMENPASWSRVFEEEKGIMEELDQLVSNYFK
jgi:hypothetical protein